NGKGVFLNTLGAIMGDYAQTAPTAMFTETHGERHPTELAMLQGARLVVAQEVNEGQAWNEQRIKELTGGDPIAARFMRQDFFKFDPQHTLVIAGNHKPRLRNVDEAMRRRFHMVPFTAKISPRDTHLAEKLKAEWPGILQWAINGCLEWQMFGLAPPPAVVDMTAEYFESQDIGPDWLRDRCVVAPGEKASFADLLDDYRAYMSDNREEPKGWSSDAPPVASGLTNISFSGSNGNQTTGSTKMSASLGKSDPWLIVWKKSGLSEIGQLCAIMIQASHAS
ncbi:MAG TPA: phage/plasmid primase, P4 family, partial [Xanthobacteraceae bacterium]|nr:phage/plasmid primase, P4 family [Xanthobacteraceae bacterium]